MTYPRLKLYYWDLPARAEVTRVMLTYAGIPFEDTRIKYEEWPALKTRLPFGQLPVLEVDGKQLAQSAAIERYAAQLAGLYPTDPWQAAKVDEHLEFIRDLHAKRDPAFLIKDLVERNKAQADLVQGPVKAYLVKLQELLGNADYYSGNQPMYPE